MGMIFAPFCCNSAINAPALSARSFFRSAPKPKTWQRSSVCLRFNFPFLGNRLEPKPWPSRLDHAEVSGHRLHGFHIVCNIHFKLSPVLGQMSTSRNSEVLRNKFLAKVSDTIAACYLRSVQIFFTTFEELGGNLRNKRGGPSA